MKITVLAGGVGAATFLTGLLAHLRDTPTLAPEGIQLTVIGNTADDITLHGLRICPDLDTVMYTLGGGIHPEQHWGRADETFTVAEELRAYGSGAEWFTLGDRDFATHIVRTRLLGQGQPLSEVTAVLNRRWQTGVQLLPMTNDRVETHVTIDDPLADGGLRAIHFQEWWVRHHAEPKAFAIHAVGLVDATPAPGVLEAIREADIVLLPPSNPVVSIGPILGVAGIREALRETQAPVVGVSPVIDGSAVRGMANQCLASLGLPATCAAVAGLYRDFLDGWLVAEEDAADAEEIRSWAQELPTADVAPATITVLERPLLMDSPEHTQHIASAAVDLAMSLTSAS